MLPCVLKSAYLPSLKAFSFDFTNSVPGFSTSRVTIPCCKLTNASCVGYAAAASWARIAADRLFIICLMSRKSGQDKNVLLEWAGVELQSSSKIVKRVCISPSPMLIWPLQRSQCFKIRVASTLGRERAHYSENESVRSKSQEFSRKFKRRGVCFNDLWRVLWLQRELLSLPQALVG